MNRRLLRAKIHRAHVTHADVDYEGSITIPPELMQAIDMLEHEAVSVWNVTNGNRFDTYAITGQAGSDAICVNGAAAHLVKPGDRVIIAAFADFSEEEAASYEPKVIFIDKNNLDYRHKKEVPGPLRSVS